MRGRKTPYFCVTWRHIDAGRFAGESRKAFVGAQPKTDEKNNSRMQEMLRGGVDGQPLAFAFFLPLLLRQTASREQWQKGTAFCHPGSGFVCFGIA